MAQALYNDKKNSIADICKTLRISRSTLYRYITAPLATIGNFADLRSRQILIKERRQFSIKVTNTIPAYQIYFR